MSLPVYARLNGPNGARRAFTLIETLLAVAIAAAALSLALSLYHTVGRVVDKQQEQRHLKQQIPRALDTITADLIRAYHAEGDTNGILRLVSENNATQLSFSATRQEGQRWPWLRNYRITYTFHPDRNTITRVQVPIAGPSSAGEPSEQDILANSIASFQIELRIKEAWTNHWTSSSDGVWPVAARILMRKQEDGTEDFVEITLPAGMTFQPSETNKPE